MLRTLLLLLCAAPAVHVLAASDAAHTHHMPAGPTEVGAQAVHDSRGVLWAVHRVSGHVAVSHSDDDGQSWSNPVLVTRAPEPIDAGSDARPKIALGPDDEIYLTWTSPLAEPYTGEIRFSRSLDGGRTFSAPQVVHRDRQVITHRFDAIAVNSRGQIFVAWIDKRDLAAAGGTESGYRGAALYFAVSDDRGSTFRGDFKVADHTCECCRIALVARPDGTATALWRHIFAPNIRDHAMATLHPDGRAGRVERATFEDWKLDACPHHGPALAVDAEDAPHGVWFSGAPTSRGLFYARLGGNAPRGLRRIGSDASGYPDIAASGQRVALAWKEFANSQTLLLGMISSDGGNTWQTVKLGAATGATAHPQILAHKGRFFVFWNTAQRPLAVIPFP